MNAKGKNNSNYIDGKGDYPYPNKFKKIRPKILKRDNYTCQECNSKITLVVHHIDYNRTHNHKKNLITLCQSCNMKANFNRDYWYAYFRYTIDKVQ